MFLVLYLLFEPFLISFIICLSCPIELYKCNKNDIFFNVTKKIKQD